MSGSRFGKEFSANALHAWFNDPAQKPIVQQPTYNQGQQSQQSQSQPNSGNQQSQGNRQQTSSQSSTQSSTQGQPSQQPSTPRHSHPNDEYFQPTLPGLELFHVGSGYDPEQEAMNREMERRKRKRKRKGRRL